MGNKAIMFRWDDGWEVARVTKSISGSTLEVRFPEGKRNVTLRGERYVSQNIPSSWVVIVRDVNVNTPPLPPKGTQMRDDLVAAATAPWQQHLASSQMERPSNSSTLGATELLAAQTSASTPEPAAKRVRRTPSVFPPPGENDW
jgi:hypothetical protein